MKINTSLGWAVGAYRSEEWDEKERKSAKSNFYIVITTIPMAQDSELTKSPAMDD